MPGQVTGMGIWAAERIQDARDRARLVAVGHEPGFVTPV
jgi:hypothetical protein